MKIPSISKQWQVILILILGVLTVSTSAIFVRLSMVAAGLNTVGFSIFIAAFRLMVSGILIIPAWRGVVGQSHLSKKAFLYAIGAGFCLGLHFVTWISSLSFTSIAASTTMVTTNPIWIAILSWLWFKEKLNKYTTIGMGIAIGGGIIIAVADNARGIGSNPLLGFFLALLGSWLVSFYIILGREAQKNGLSISSYIAIAYTTGAVILFPLPFIFGSGYFGYSQLVYVYLLIMTIVCQLIGHTCFNWVIRFISPTLVTLMILFEPIIASILAFFIFDEIPPANVCLGGLILLIGVGVAVISSNKQ